MGAASNASHGLSLWWGKAFDLFVKTYESKYPKATLCLQKDREELMAFFDFPAQHWQSIRTSNPIESAFATTCGTFHLQTDRAQILQTSAVQLEGVSTFVLPHLCMTMKPPKQLRKHYVILEGGFGP